eukprot:4837841-Pyramimonas_sp.AAC.2
MFDSLLVVLGAYWLLNSSICLALLGAPGEIMPISEGGRGIDRRCEYREMENFQLDFGKTAVTNPRALNSHRLPRTLKP